MSSSSSVMAPTVPVGSLNPFNPNSSPGSSYMVNSRIMVVAVAVLFGVVLFVFCFHIYAKWFWRDYRASIAQAGPAYSQSWNRRRRGQLNFLMMGDDNNNNHHQSLAPHLLDGFGLDKAVVELLPTFVYRAAEMKGTSVLECAVCLEEFKEKETGRLLPRCNHSFHTDCIDMWFSSHSNCPLCRTSVKLPDKQAAPHESWQLMDVSNPARPPDSSPHQQLLLLESRNTVISSTQTSQAAAGSSLNTVSSSIGAPGAGAAGVSANQGSTQQENVAGGMYSTGLGSEERHDQQQNQVPTTTTSSRLPPEKRQERNGSNLSGTVGSGANIPPNVLFWGAQTHPNAAAQSSSTTTIITMELQQQQGPKFASSGDSAGAQASSVVAVEIMASTSRSPVAVAEAEGSSMARLVSLKRLLSRGRPIPSSAERQNSTQTDLEQGASSSSSSSSSSAIRNPSAASHIMTFFLSP